MELTFLRHATTDLNGKGFIATQLDYHINEKGVEQCKQLTFEKDEFNSVYCSPFKRTQDTAQLVYPYKKPFITPLITQRNLGVLNEKKKWEYDIEYLNAVRTYLITPNGAESLIDLKKRIDTFFEFLKQQQSNDDNILVVSHNGIMRIIKQYYMPNYEEIETENLGKFVYKLKK